MPIRSQIITLKPNVFYQNYCNQHMCVVTFYAQISCNLCMCMCVWVYFSFIAKEGKVDHGGVTVNFERLVMGKYFA